MLHSLPRDLRLANTPAFTYAIGQQVRELGIQLAFGASPRFDPAGTLRGD